tara:strand:- start:2030 stop:2284 length:255 start_codon:yes stop_codon:yes gene_type:complete
MIIYISKEESDTAGCYRGKPSWGPDITPIAVSKGFPEKVLYQGSTQVSGCWDDKGGLYLSDLPGGIGLGHLNPGEVETWKKSHP